ncbi:hypothetical protein LCGC14_0461060 [marine sediment metagenome]|uniref:Uncharacterized protein n=1 Tax=marine sediment metagenome TaxID=412755 RepID=A0A0F9SK95_9ZZZZ|nr:hypothetical protein [bacterium]
MLKDFHFYTQQEIDAFLNPRWDDLRVPLNSIKTGGVKDPTFTKWKDDGAGSRGIYDWHFAYQVVAGNEEEVFFDTQLPHSYKEGADLNFHVHWTPLVSGAAGEFVKFGLEYTWVNINENFPANTTIIYSDASSAAAASTSGDGTLIHGKQYKTLFPAITGTGMRISSVLSCRFFRNSSHANDTLAQDVIIFDVDFHFEIDSLGSKTILIK